MNGEGASSDVPAAPTGVDATTYGSLSLQNKVTYQGVDGTGGYDAVGNVVAYQYQNSSGRIDQYNVAYYRKDSYLEAATSGQNITNTQNVRPASDQSYYDDRGNRVAIVQHTQANGGQLQDDVRIFAYDGYGQIIERRDGTAAGDAFTQGSNTTHENQHYVYVNGQQVAHYDEGGTLDVIDQVTAFANSGAGTSGYIVQAGDSLRSIAQAVYGNASYWYIIAQANALSSDNDLAIGQNLQIPQVTTTANTATTFKPYNPSDIAGSTTPNLPTIAPPPVPPAHHCNIVAAIVVIAVIVVATILTAGALAPAALSASSTLFGAGIGVLSGAAGLSAATIGAAFAAGVVGNIAGQLAGDALGTHSGLSLGQAFVSGFTTAVTAGIGAELQSVGTASNAFVQGGKLTFAGGAIEGAGAYAGTVVGSHLAGQESQFSWAGLVAAAVSGGAAASLTGSSVGRQIGQTTGSFAGDVGAGLLRGELNSEISRGLGDDRVPDFESIAENAIGNAAGNAAAGWLGAVPASSTGQTSKQILDDYERTQAYIQRESALSEKASPLDTSYGSVGFDFAARSALGTPIVAAEGAYAGYVGQYGLGDETGAEVISGKSVGAPTDAQLEIDRKALATVNSLGLDRLAAPDDPHVHYISVVFDGTANDPSSETNPYLIGNDLIVNEGKARSSVIYETGLGTGPEGELAGGAFGTGGKGREFDALRQVGTQMQQIYNDDPDAQVILVGLGFSRGSAEARDFANLVDQGVPIPGTYDSQSEKSQVYTGDQAPRFGALVIYDTVGSFGLAGTNLNPGYDLSIPASVEHVLHVTANDESRLFFPLSSATETTTTGGIVTADEGRIVQIGLPGVHSDIGGGYHDPYQFFSLDMGYSFLGQLGVPLRPLSSGDGTYDFNVNDYSGEQMHLHDSSWGIDRALHLIGVHEHRTVFPSNNPEK